MFPLPTAVLTVGGIVTGQLQGRPLSLYELTNRSDNTDKLLSFSFLCLLTFTGCFLPLALPYLITHSSCSVSVFLSLDHTLSTHSTHMWLLWQQETSLTWEKAAGSKTTDCCKLRNYTPGPRWKDSSDCLDWPITFSVLSTSTEGCNCSNVYGPELNWTGLLGGNRALDRN